MEETSTLDTAIAKSQSWTPQHTHTQTHTNTPALSLIGMHKGPHTHTHTHTALTHCVGQSCPHLNTS